MKFQEAGIKVNAKIFFFSKAETEYLGYMITCNGIKPVPKKVAGLLKIDRPTKKKELCHFISMVNYYRDMWKHRSHILAPLAILTSKNAKFK